MDWAAVIGAIVGGTEIGQAISDLVVELVRDPSKTQAKISEALSLYNLTRDQINSVYNKLTQKLSAYGNLSYGLVSDVIRKGSVEASQQLANKMRSLQNIESKLGDEAKKLDTAQTVVQNFQWKSGPTKWLQEDIKKAESTVSQAKQNIGSLVDQANKIYKEIN